MKIAYIVEPRKVIGGGVRAAINLVKAMKQYYEEDAMVFGKHTAEKVFNIHNPTSYDEAASDSCKQMNFRTEAHLLRQPKANQGQFFRPVRLQAT